VIVPLEGDIERKLFLQTVPTLITKLRCHRRLERAWQLIEKDYDDADLDLERAAKRAELARTI
jgi:uncharacterized FlgJ-related protein